MSAAPSARVAIVIPAWGAYVRWLAQAVESVHAQEIEPEIVVVDNASEVPVPALPGMTVVRSERRLTTGAARNLGFAAVSAPLVVFLDADDVLLPGSLAALVEGIERHPEAVAFAMAMLDGDTGERHRAPRRLARSLARVPRLFALVNAMWSLLPTQGATILRADDVRAVGAYADRSTGEDWVLGASLAWRGRVHFDERPALVYRWRQDSPGRGGEAGTLRANARAVRERLRSDRAAPAAARRLLPLVALGQWLAIVVMRPAALGLRRLLGRSR